MTMDVLADAPECLECGTCCFSDLERYIRVTGDDHERLGEQAARLTTFLGNRCFMRMEGGHCAALIIDRRERRFVCSIYEQRPALCRELDRGSPQCAGERALKASRPPKTLTEM